MKRRNKRSCKSENYKKAQEQKRIQQVELVEEVQGVCQEDFKKWQDEEGERENVRKGERGGVNHGKQLCAAE